MTSTTPQTNPLADKLRAEVESIPGATLIASPKGNYYTVKVGKTTLGYVNGSRVLRVDLPKRGGTREKFVVAKAGDVAKAVRKLRAFEPTILDRENENESKPAPAKRTRSRAKAATK